MEENWFVEFRMDWIRESVLIFGQINRENICLKFGVSVPQASKDIQKVMERWPDLMTYNRSAKRYERNGPPPVELPAPF